MKSVNIVVRAVKSVTIEVRTLKSVTIEVKTMMSVIIEERTLTSVTIVVNIWHVFRQSYSSVTHTIKSCNSD